MAEIFTNAKQRVLQVAEFKGENKESFFENLGVSYGNFKGKSKNSALGSDVLAKISTMYPDINPGWLLTGGGNMIISEKDQGSVSTERLIPIFGDVTTFGGLTQIASNGTASPTGYMRPGDWFPGATAAIRHYGESMKEYPSGSLLGLKEIFDLWDGIVPGQNYVIEYGSDYNMVTKRLQKVEGKIIAYSSNVDTYPDGTFIHQPFEIKKIHRLFLVLGMVVKSHNTGLMLAG